MRKQKTLAKEFQFYFSDLDNLLLVESLDDGTVRIRHTRDNLSEQRRFFFIRKLAAEGFIPDEYQWFSGSTNGTNHVVWIKDYSWLKTHTPSRSRANRFMIRSLVAGCILLAAILRILIVSNGNPPQHNTKANTPRTLAVSGVPQMETPQARPR